jgi:hypothetical protein
VRRPAPVWMSLIEGRRSSPVWPSTLLWGGLGLAIGWLMFAAWYRLGVESAAGDAVSIVGMAGVGVCWGVAAARAVRARPGWGTTMRVVALAVIMALQPLADLVTRAAGGKAFERATATTLANCWMMACCWAWALSWATDSEPRGPGWVWGLAIGVQVVLLGLAAHATLSVWLGW